MFRGIQKSTIHVPLVTLAMLMAETGHAQNTGQIGVMVLVTALATNDPIRQAAQPVGLLCAIAFAVALGVPAAPGSSEVCRSRGKVECGE
jgi:hypothetical protein